MPEVDIILPVYNTDAKLLQKCLKSLFGQSYNNINIIVVDDGTTDEQTFSILKSLERKKNHISIEVFHQKNSGVSDARNFGLKHARGKYVVFVDADDYINPKFIQQLVKTAQKYNAPIVSPKFIFFSSTSKEKSLPQEFVYLPDDIWIFINDYTLFSTHGVLIDIDLAKAHTFNRSLIYGEDIEYMIRVTRKQKIARSTESIYYYNTNNNDSAMHMYDLENLTKFCADTYIMLKKFATIYSSYADRIMSLFINTINSAGAKMILAGKSKREYKKFVKREYDKLTVNEVKSYMPKSIASKIKAKLLTRRRYNAHYFFTKALLRKTK